MRGFGRKNKEKYIFAIATQKRNILHVGCTNSPNTQKRIETNGLLHAKLLDISNDIVGIDIDSVAIEIMREHFPSAELVAGDAHCLSNYFGDRKFDLIVAADVIEHLNNPGLFLESCRRQLMPGGEIIVTTSNTFHIGRFLKAALFHEAVHDQHTAYYSPKTLQRLGEMGQIKTKEYGYYSCEPLSYNASINRAVTNLIEKCATLVWPQLSEGVIVLYGTHSETHAEAH